MRRRFPRFAAGGAGGVSPHCNKVSSANSLACPTTNSHFTQHIALFVHTSVSYHLRRTPASTLTRDLSLVAFDTQHATEHSDSVRAHQWPLVAVSHHGCRQGLGPPRRDALVGHVRRALAEARKAADGDVGEGARARPCHKIRRVLCQVCPFMHAMMQVAFNRRA
jgi:hypothetical protein